MLALVAAAWFIGYLLVYAAVRDGGTGALALNPWKALRG